MITDENSKMPPAHEMIRCQCVTCLQEVGTHQDNMTREQFFDLLARQGWRTYPAKGKQPIRRQCPTCIKQRKPVK